MRIKTTVQVNTHLQDGRKFAADEGDVVEIHEDDDAMVGLARSLVMSGQARHHGDAGEVDEEVPVEVAPAVESEERDDDSDEDDD